MATERYQYAVADENGHAIMPELWAQAVVAAIPGCSIWRRVERIDVSQVTHGEWHPVQTGGK